MSDSELSRLFAAERAEAPSAPQTARGWEELTSALQADLPALAVAHGPLQLGLSLATKSLIGSGLVAFAITTAGLGVHASLQAPAASAPLTVVSAQAPAVAVVAPTTTSVALDAAPAATPAVSAAAALPKSSTDAMSTFAEELRLIKAAKRELEAGRAHLARVWLDQHARLYPNGIFRKERAELERRLGSGPAPAGNFPETGQR